MNGVTHMALLTPTGRGAIATLAIRGARAWEIAHALFQLAPAKTTSAPRKLPDQPVVGRFWLGRLGEPGKGGSDEVVLCVRQAEPIPWLEVHCHGGDQAVGLVHDVLAKQGAVACSWQEFEQQAGAGRLRVLAQEELARAPTLRTARILLDQFHGAFEGEVREALLRLHYGETNAAVAVVRQLASRQHLGRHLVMPWRVVVAGPPNVGKSSLVNALAGFTRCLVSPQPGTTRDVVTTTLAIDGWPVELADTAGWRGAAPPLEGKGIDRAKERANDADLCLWLLDGSTAPILPEKPGGNVALVVSKIDLPAAWDWQELASLGRVSAQSGAGIKELCAAISQRLVPEPPPAGAGVPFTAELNEHIEQAELACCAERMDEARDRLSQILDPLSAES